MKLCDSIAALVNTVVGKVNVTLPQEKRDASYECAAWWSEYLSATGTFDVYLRQDPYNKERLYLHASLPSLTTADFFPSLYCGNLIGKPYDVHSKRGTKGQDVGIVCDLLKGCRETSHSTVPANGCKWTVSPEYWPAIRDHFAAMVAKYRKSLESFAMDFDNGKQNGGAGYRFSMLAHCANGIATNASAADEMDRLLEPYGGRGIDTESIARNNPFLASPVPVTLPTLPPVELSASNPAKS